MQTDIPPESWINDRRQDWLTELSPEDYKRCMSLLEEVLGIPYSYSPGATATALLRSLHANGKKMLPAEMPAPALDPSTEGDLKWMRPLTDSEQAAPFIVCYDVNAAYLACMSALPLGVGAPRHTQWPLSLEERFTSPVGYFNTAEGWVTSVTLSSLPGGYAFPSQCYLWSVTSRPLEPLYKRLRDARETLLIQRGGWPYEDHPETIDAALLTVKHMYTDLIGRFASTKWDRTGDPMFRPDARHMIIATRRTRVQRVISQCDPEPFAASCDQLYFAVQASPAVQGLRMGTNPGSWKIHGTVHHAGAVRAATDAGNLSALVELVR